MDEQKLLENVKSALRVTTDDVGINAEIKMLVESAKMDLQMSGIRVKNTAEDGTVIYDDIIALAITLYCKAKFGFDNPEAERLYQSYRTLETHLSLSTEYRGVIQ